MKQIRWTIIPFVLFILSCSPAYTIKVDLTNNDIRKRTLVVLPFQGNPEIEYRGDVTNEFGPGDMNELIIAYLQNKLEKNLSVYSLFKKVEHYSSSSTTSGLDTNIHVDRRHIFPFCFPSDFKDSTFCNKYDVALLLSGPKVSTGTIINTYYGIPVSIRKSLAIQMGFVYWDLKKKEIISTGRAYGQSVAKGPYLVLSNWDDASIKTYIKLTCDDIYSKP